VRISDVSIDSLHLSAGSIAQILRDYHASNVMQHHRVASIASQVGEFNIGAVREVSVDDVMRRGAGRQGATACPVRAVVPVAFNFRDEGVLADPGTNGFALVTVAMLFEFPMHRGEVPAHFRDCIRIDCSSTNADDIALSGLDGSLAADISAILVQFVHRYIGGTYPLPRAMGPLSTANEPIEVLTYAGPAQQIAIRSVPAGQKRSLEGETSIVTAFNPGNAAWAAFVSAQSLQREMPKLVHGIRGILEAADAMATHEPAVTFEDGFLNVTSAFQARTDARDSGTKSGGTWRMRICLGGATVQGAPTCVARPLDAVGGIATEVERKICSLVSALLLPAAISRRDDVRRSHDVKWMIEAGDSRVDSAGAELERQDARFLYTEIRRGGVLFHGVIDQLEAPGPPVVEFRYLRTPSSWGQFTFNAMTSWSPGCEIVAVDWNFGDGETNSSAGAGVAFVATHTFSGAGEFDVILQVKDSLGRVAVHQERIVVGRVTLEIGVPLATGPNRYRTPILLKSGNTPVPHIALQLVTPQGTQELTADQDGQMICDGDQVLFARPSIQQWSRDLTASGTVRVEALTGPLEWPVRVLDGESYGRVTSIVQLCDRMLTQIQLDSPQDAGKEHLRSLLVGVKEGLRHGSLSGLGALVEQNVPPGDGVPPGMPESRPSLDALRVSLERLAVSLERLTNDPRRAAEASR
jgi:hypothetical protein